MCIVSSFSGLIQLAFWAGYLFVSEVSPMYCWLLSIIPGFYQWDTNSKLPTLIYNNEKCHQASSERFYFLRLQNHWGQRLKPWNKRKQTNKKNLLLGSKATTNLDSILKNRDITLLTKVCLVKSMVFPVVMYGC